ncbi:MAG: zinc-ribbon domain-containing protein [Acidobacteriota bacterium]
MVCAKCGSENREESNFCRYCSAPLKQPNSGYIPSVPPPGVDTANPFSSQQTYQQAPQPPMAMPAAHAAHGLICPRCGSANVLKGSTPIWAIVATVVGFFFVCIVSLLFLLVKDPNKCLNCGLDFK